jgi:hypothetical protein
MRLLKQPLKNSSKNTPIPDLLDVFIRTLDRIDIFSSLSTLLLYRNKGEKHFNMKRIICLISTSSICDISGWSVFDKITAFIN